MTEVKETVDMRTEFDDNSLVDEAIRSLKEALHFKSEVCELYKTLADDLKVSLNNMIRERNRLYQIAEEAIQGYGASTSVANRATSIGRGAVMSPQVEQELKLSNLAELQEYATELENAQKELLAKLNQLQATIDEI